MLAQAVQQLPDPNSFASIGWLLVGLGALALLLNQGADFLNRFRAKEPTPPLHEQYATKDELDEVKRQVGELDEKIDSQFEKLRNERRVSVAELHKRIEGVSGGMHERVTELLKSFSELKGTVQQALKETRHPFGK